MKTIGNFSGEGCNLSTVKDVTHQRQRRSAPTLILLCELSQTHLVWSTDSSGGGGRLAWGREQRQLLLSVIKCWMSNGQSRTWGWPTQQWSDCNEGQTYHFHDLNNISHQLYREVRPHVDHINSFNRGEFTKQGYRKVKGHRPLHFSV